MKRSTQQTIVVTQAPERAILVAVARKDNRDGWDVEVTLDELAHQPNEYCVLDNLIGDTKVFAHMFLQK